MQKPRKSRSGHASVEIVCLPPRSTYGWVGGPEARGRTGHSGREDAVLVWLPIERTPVCYWGAAVPRRLAQHTEDAAPWSCAVGQEEQGLQRPRHAVFLRPLGRAKPPSLPQPTHRCHAVDPKIRLYAGTWEIRRIWEGWQPHRLISNSDPGPNIGLLRSIFSLF